VVLITTVKTCCRCDRTIALRENLSGLVFNDEHFLCEECVEVASEDDMAEWSRSIMQKPGSGMPIAIWLIHEQNKNKTMMSTTK